MTVPDRVCEGCGSTDEKVQPCCTNEGRKSFCVSCMMNPKLRTLNHVCGVGIETFVNNEEPT